MTIETLRGLAGDFSPPALERRDDDPSQMPGSSLENPRTSWERVFEVEPVYTGRRVSEIGSLQLAAVWRCVSLISGAIARVPFVPYRRTDNGKDIARDHYLWPLFMRQANPYMSAYRFRRAMQTWLLLWGNAYAEIEISGRGQVVGLWPWRPDRVEIKGRQETLSYTYRMDSGERVTLPAHFILHLRGLETDGVRGLSPIRSARQSIGLALAAEEYGARYFGAGGKPGALLETPNKLSREGRKNLTESFLDIHGGLKGAHRLGILEEGLKYKEVGVPPEDMQFLQTRQFQAIDIARLFGVPPHKIAELSRATFSNIEHQSIEFVSDCLDDWFANWSAECGASLLSEREAETIELEFFSERLMRGDMLGRYRAYAIARNWGWMSANDVCDRENMNRFPGGDQRLVPLNMVPASAGGTPPESEDPEDPDPDEKDAALEESQARADSLEEENQDLRRRLARTVDSNVALSAELGLSRLKEAVPVNGNGKGE